jgi:hypothetical protein
MRGAVTWEEGMEMSVLERKECFSFIERRMKDIKDHQNPVY